MSISGSHWLIPFLTGCLKKVQIFFSNSGASSSFTVLSAILSVDLAKSVIFLAVFLNRLVSALVEQVFLTLPGLCDSLSTLALSAMYFFQSLALDVRKRLIISCTLSGGGGLAASAVCLLILGYCALPM